MEEKYVTLIQNQMNEGGDPQLVRNLEFTVPTAETLAKMYIKNPPYVDKNRDEVRATPIENIMAAKELLEHKKSPAALETAVKLMTKALVQQEKAMSSRRLKSDPRHKTNMLPPKYKTFEVPKGGIVIRDNDGKRG
jgi:hypothetical protein